MRCRPWHLFGDIPCSRHPHVADAFYASPAGQACLARIPALTQSVMKALMVKLADMQPRLDQILREAAQEAPGSATAPK
jgi:hypothetical protein